jgi:hypothetical protein
MAYTIKNYAQTVTLGTVNDNSIDTSLTSLTLIGKNYATYGTALNENFVYLLENFSSPFPGPAHPITGQVWWDNVNNYLCVWDGTNWQTVYGHLSSLYVNTSITASSITATSSFTAANLNASGGGRVNGYLNGAIGANVANTGSFTSITTGSTQVNGTLTAGTLNAATIGNTGTTFSGANLTLTSTILTSGTVQAANVLLSGGGQINGYLTGALGANIPNSVVATSVTTSSGGQVIGYLTGAIGANTANTAAFTTANVNGTLYAATINASTIGNTGTSFTGTLSTAAQPNITSLGNVTGLSASGAIIPSSNNSITLGNATAYWSTVYGVSFVGTSTTAKYGDLAERYKADQYYAPGTVVVFGGGAEITTSELTHDAAVAGVVSTNPAYLMNEKEDKTYLAIALQGRVPCAVWGPVSKGQQIVTSGTAGVGQAMNPELYNPGCVIGKSLEDHLENAIKVIEVVVGRV